MLLAYFFLIVHLETALFDYSKKTFIFKMYTKGKMKFKKKKTNVFIDVLYNHWTVIDVCGIIDVRDNASYFRKRYHREFYLKTSCTVTLPHPPTSPQRSVNENAFYQQVVGSHDDVLLS